MPTGTLSLGTIAQRLRAAADSSTLPTGDIENLAACAQTLEGGWPSTKQLRAITTVVENLAPIVNTPQFWRCVTSLDHWVSNGRPPKKPVPASKKPQWMVDNEEADAEAASALASHDAICAVTRMIEQKLDLITASQHDHTTFDDLNALVLVLKRLA